MDTPYIAVNALLNNEDSVLETLQTIESLNTLRKTKTLEHTENALEGIDSSHNVIIYHAQDIEHGIIGIVAGRLCEQFHRPSIVLVDEGEKLVASCRSPEYCSIISILDEFSSDFLAYGGHSQAAGFSIAKEGFDDFVKRLQNRF